MTEKTVYVYNILYVLSNWESVLFHLDKKTNQFIAELSKLKAGN